jgi:hypothetical protein
VPRRRSLISNGKIVAFIKDDLKRRGVSLHQHVWKGRLVLQVGPSALMPRVLIISDVVPGPTVERVLLDLGRIFERGIVAQLIALVDRAPGTAGRRLNGDINRKTRRNVAPAGIGTTSTKFGVDLPIGGKSFGLSWRLRPGLSCSHPPRTAFPLSSCPLLSSAGAAITLPHASNPGVAAISTILSIQALQTGS